MLAASNTPGDPASLATHQAVATPGGPPIGMAPMQEMLTTSVRMGLSILEQGEHSGRIVAKMDAQHITQVIDLSGKADERRHLDRQESRKAGLKLAALGLVFVFALSWLFLAFGKTDMLLPIITHITTGALGLFGGYGYARSNLAQKP